MKTALVLTGVLILTGAVLPAAAQTAAHTPQHAAEQAGNHRLYTPQEVPWTAAPPSLPRGAEAAVLYGDPTFEGPFVLRLRFPSGYRIPAHRHPGAEILTVISGTFLLGTGEASDPAQTRAMPAGSFTAMPGGMVHSAQAEGVTVVQLNSIGPWSVEYINPNDDPRQQPR